MLGALMVDKPPYRDKGSAIIVYIIIFAVAALAVAGFFYERQQMVKALNEKTEQVAKLEKTVEENKLKIDGLEKDKESLNKQIELLNTITQDLTKKRTEAVKEKNELQRKLEAYLNKLPPVLTDKETTPETITEQLNSQKRITTIWDVYCMKNEHPKCVKEEVKK